MPETYRVPSLDAGDRAKVESILAAPCRTVGGQLAYPTLADQGAVLFYEACKMHAFIDGNKRIALLLLLAFLGENGRRLTASPASVAARARETAASASANRSIVVSELANWVGLNLTWLGNR